MKTEPIIFFERFSFLKFISLVFVIRKDVKLYVLNVPSLRGGDSDQSKAEKYKNFVMSLVNVFLPDAEVRFIGNLEVPKIMYTAKYTLPEFIENKDEMLRDSNYTRVLMKLYNDIGIVKGMKQSILLRLRKSWYFRHFAEHLSERYNSPIMIVPEWSDQFAIFDDCPFLYLPRRIVLINYLKNIYGVAKTIMMYFYILFGNTMKITKIKTKHVRYAIQVAHGPFEGNQDAETRKVRAIFNSRCLEDGKDFSLHNILYVFGSWPFPSEKLKRWLKFIKQKNGMYFFENNPPPDVAHVFTVQLWGYGRSLLSSMILLIANWNSWMLAQTALSLLAKVNRYEIFCKHYRLGSFLGFDDYATQHIARTIVFKKYGVRNIGMCHQCYAGLYRMPELSYIYFSDYLVLGKIMKEKYMSFWGNQPLKILGVKSGDNIYESIHNTGRQMGFKRKYGNKFKIAVLMYKFSNKYNLEYKKEEFYQGLTSIHRIYPDIPIILRPRHYEVHHIDKYCAEFLASNNSYANVFLEYEFDAHELIAYSDLIIGFNDSTPVAEAVCAGRRVFGFTINGIDHFNPYRQLDKRLSVYNKEEFIKLVHYYINEPDSIKVSKSACHKLGLPIDGKTVERIRASLM